MRVAVVGAGVNGICSAISIADSGHNVTVFDSGNAFSETSSKSSRMFHGGIRYLEQGHLSLVKEALRERKAWMDFCPDDTYVKRFYIPIYKSQSRSRFKLFLGVKLYEWLAGKYSLGYSQYHSKKDTLSHIPNLKEQGLIGSVSYLDAVFNDVAVSQKLLEKLKDLGGVINEGVPVESLTDNGAILLADGHVKKFDFIVNAAGPWSSELLKTSKIYSSVSLDLIRGSHLVVDYKIAHPVVFQVAEDQRIIFLIPMDHYSLLGTTEVAQSINSKVEITNEEMEYLLGKVNSSLITPINKSDVIGSFSGLRPIIKASENEGFSRASRESQIEKFGRLVSVFGGKWTSAMSVGKKVSLEIQVR